VRIVLSGYTELQSITDAINEGAIYKFLTKPWDDRQLRSHIEEAFRRKEMTDENRRLQQQVHAANKQLADVNVQLQILLNRTQERLTRDGTSLDVAREVLQYIPLAMIGVDGDGMVAFANPSAEDLLCQGGLLGRDAAEVLPDPLLAIRRACNDDGQSLQSTALVELGGKDFRAICRIMGESSQSSGSLFILMAS
jgi:PAS domain-containing protein